MKFSYSNILGQSCKLCFCTELILARVHGGLWTLDFSTCLGTGIARKCFLGFSTEFNLVQKFLVRNRTNLNACENFPLYSILSTYKLLALDAVTDDFHAPVSFIIAFIMGCLIMVIVCI